MLYEYAVEPQAIGSDWHTFRYVIEKFGFDKGWLISQFPNWLHDVYQAAEGLPDLQKKRVEGALNLAKKDKVARFGRPNNPELGGWLDNALAEHRREPFHAIMATANPGGEEPYPPMSLKRRIDLGALLSYRQAQACSQPIRSQSATCSPVAT